jgi:phosphoribosylformylglycinamidine synthase
MASAAFEADAEEKRPTVQVGDPFAEKLLLEACLELMASGAVIAIQDMGAAGLTSSAVEMGAKGDLGVELDLDRVPCREAGMSAYEMMLSESQERMLMVLHPEKAAAAEAIFRKWGLEFAVIGETTDTKRFVVKLRGEVKADLPIRQLGDEAPLYDRPWTPTQRAPILAAEEIAAPIANRHALLKLLASPDLSCKRWVTEQYDTLILGNTIEGPGGDAAVVRLGDGPKGLALTTDATERYCEADPVEGGRQAVAEAWRNLIAVGARPLALTDCLNFGNPEKPEAMGQFVGCLTGIGEAARALDFPVVSGNVSLYNETSGVGVPPTPTIGGVGLIEDVAKAASPAFKREGEAVLLIGGAPGWLGRSAWLATILKREEGAPPPVDLAAERRNGEFVLSLVRGSKVDAVHDLSDGGLAVALAEMAIAGGIGVAIEKSAVEGSAHAFLFGEDQGRYVVTARAEDCEALLAEARRAGVPAARLGTTGGGALDLPGEPQVAIAALREAFESWFPTYMDGPKGERA